MEFILLIEPISYQQSMPRSHPPVAELTRVDYNQHAPQ